jgi:cytoskeletal protein CcmA (bactofilin family)
VQGKEVPVALTSRTPRIAFAPEQGRGGGRRLSRPLVPGIPSRVVDPSGVVKHQYPDPCQAAGAEETPDRDAGQADAGALVVGAGITVKGEIRTCRTLVVHGTVEATLPAETIEIGPGGEFRGRAEVETATVSGRFDGDLVVSGHLTVTASGEVDGRVQYREIAVDSGGCLRGTAEPLDARQSSPDGAGAYPAADAPEPADPAAPQPEAAPAAESGDAPAAVAADETPVIDAPAPSEDPARSDDAVRSGEPARLAEPESVEDPAHPTPQAPQAPKRAAARGSARRGHPFARRSA